MLLKTIRRTILPLVFLLILVFGKNFVYSQTPTSTPTSVSCGSTPGCENLDCNSYISCLNNKISEKQGQEKTLSSQISVMDNQIRLTEARILATRKQIADISLDIDTTEKKISGLEEALDKLAAVLVNRIVATYEIGTIQPIQILLTSNNVSDFLSRLNYLRIAQMQDKKLMYATQQAKNDYANQKEIFETKKRRVEALKNQLETYTVQLASEKKDKENLLTITRNSEKEYQDLLARARAEQAAIEGVIATIKLVNGTAVKEGDLIAVVGNTGAPYCSTGPHLHFETRRNGVLEDPNNYLRSGISFIYSYPTDLYTYYGTINPHGNWSWPLNEPVKINQGYGSWGFSRSFYRGGVHTGIDMESDSSLIKAPKDGTLYKGSTSCNGVTMNYAAIDHGDGLISWYWHVR